MRSVSAHGWVLAFGLLLWTTTTQAQTRRIELEFTPTGRAQLAVWVESAEGQSHFQTLGLTQSVSFRGIGNRPGATQMNSGYRWPYGRREGVLPIWAHRRVMFGSQRFERVIFNGRVSEGNASSAGSANEPANTLDTYYCLSFTQANSDRDHLDAVSCASTFASNKGRYLTVNDRGNQYAEPFELEDETASMTPLALGSLYPPRRDVAPCTTSGCTNHSDVNGYNDDARAVMPEIDAVTMATPAGDTPQRIVFDVPDAWPNGTYTVFVEVNVEGDYNETHNAETHPTPAAPAGAWDYWAQTFGYPYRGQPSVLYSAQVNVQPNGGTWIASQPHGYGALHGEDGNVRTMDGSISIDDVTATGSGGDRLRLTDNGRLRVHVPNWDVCRQPNPPSTCNRECAPDDLDSCDDDLVCSPEGTCVGRCELPRSSPDAPPLAGCGGHCDPSDPDACGNALLCADDGACVGQCEVTRAPDAITDFSVMRHPDRKQSHQYGHLSFSVPESVRGVASYEVRVGTTPITDAASFALALPAVQATQEGAGLMLPIDGNPGDTIEVDFGGMLPELHYYVGIRSVDDCNAPSEIATAELTTTDIYFTTVTPCFVATAAYGSPMAHEIGVLRAFRDQHLMPHAIGRALVDAYYSVGPLAAETIRDRPWLRATVRVLLAPVIALLD